MPRTKGSKNRPKSNITKDYASQIAEKQETIASLNTEIASIQKAIEEQKQMRAAFSHDLRTPMSVLKAYIEYLNRYFPQGKLTNEKVMEVVNDLDEQILRIEKFANTMKEINYLEEIRPTKSCIDSCTIEKKTRKILETLADKGKKNYKVSYQCDISEMYLDLNIYLEIVENVVANAVRFANRKISAELYSNKNQLYVIICDDGPGFYFIRFGGGTCYPAFADAER